MKESEKKAVTYPKLVGLIGQSLTEFCQKLNSQDSDTNIRRSIKAEVKLVAKTKITIFTLVKEIKDGNEAVKSTTMASCEVSEGDLELLQEKEKHSAIAKLHVGPNDSIFWNDFRMAVYRPATDTFNNVHIDKIVDPSADWPTEASH